MHATSIILATDLSDAARSAAIWARDMGTRTGLPVIVAHVVELGFDNWIHGRYQINFDEAMTTRARAEVADWYASATGDPPGTVELRVGHCYHELVAIAAKYDAGMLVMSATGKSAFARTIVGSRVLQMLSMPPCPVVVVDPISFTVNRSPRIAAAVDFSKATPEVVSVAGSLADISQGTLSLVHAFQPPKAPVLAGVEFLTASETADLMEAAEAEMRQVAGEHLPGFEGVQSDVITGAVAHALIDFVRQRRIDMLVLGHTGHWPSPREVLGSTVRRLVGNQPCTLVIAPVPPVV
ncbi:MAG: universal stress protein [Myxococcales bacterium]|nr:universal stress protein [Myxococcales bacterium]